MTRLSDLHRKLANLGRRRRWVRRATALCGTLGAAAVVLVAVFALDWLFEMSRAQRVVLLVIAVAGWAWAIRRWSLPYFGRSESELELALHVERSHGIDSDLAAALQFERPEAVQWGSPYLEEAVINRAEQLSREIDVVRNVPTDVLRTRLRWVAALAVLWGALAVFAPEHVAVFFQRLLLSARHYPTKTVIETLIVAGAEVDPQHPGERPVRAFFGESVVFEVRCAPPHIPGEPGRVVLAGRRSGLHTTLPLQPRDEGSRVFEARWPRPAEDVDFQVFIGDAWTDPGAIIVALPPVVELRAEVIPPDYAEKSSRLQMPPGLLQFSVIEGSQVVLRLTSEQRLSEAELIVGEMKERFRSDGDRPDEHGRFHYLYENREGPLGTVVESVRFSVQATDELGQRLERALEGMIRVQADQPPRVAAAAITRFVLPTGRPSVRFRAIDDYGIAAIDAVVEVVRESGETFESVRPVYRLSEQTRPEKNIEGDLPIPLADWSGSKNQLLRKGDQVKLTFRATDLRGRRPGRSAVSEPIVFEITDEQGVLANMMEADRHSAQQLRVMIERQLGIGESP